MTVVVRGRVVDDDVVDVNGVEGASVVVVAAAPPASSAPRARHCRGRFRRDIGRKMQHKRTPATLKVVVSGVVCIADPAAVVAVDPTQS